MNPIMQFIGLLIVQVIGFAAAAFNIFSYQMKDNRRLFLAKGISGVLFGVQFFLLGNYTAALINLINLGRALALVYARRKKDQWAFWLVQGLYIAGCVATFGKSQVAIGGAMLAMILSLVTTASQLAETAILMSRNGKRIRIAQVAFISPVWLVNNLLTGSIGGVVTEVFGITSVVISFLRYGVNGFEVEGKKE